MMKKKKVVFFINGLYGGGAEKVLQTLLQHINYDKFEITLYSVNKGDLNSSYPNNIKYHYVFDSCKPSASIYEKFLVRLKNKVKLWVYEHFSPKTFYRLFIKGKYDTEVAFIEGYATRIVGGSTNPESKKIAWVHIDLEQNHWTKVAYQSLIEEKQTYRVFDLVCAVSKSVLKVTNELFPGIRQLLVVHNPIDERFILGRAQVPFDNIKWIQNSFTFVSVGRLVHQKGYDLLLPIFKRLIDEGYPVSLNILGTGCDKEHLENFILENKLSSHISLLGYIDNPYSYIAKADIFVVSSRSEGYSTVVSEALILGIPVISTNCAGMNELLGENSEYGMLADNTPEALYTAIKELLENKQLYSYYKNKAKERGEQFHLSSLMTNIENIL
mgnify:CR=1 FL=1